MTKKGLLLVPLFATRCSRKFHYHKRALETVLLVTVLKSLVSWVEAEEQASRRKANKQRPKLAFVVVRVCKLCLRLLRHLFKCQTVCGKTNSKTCVSLRRLYMASRRCFADAMLAANVINFRVPWFRRQSFKKRICRIVCGTRKRELSKCSFGAQTAKHRTRVWRVDCLTDAEQPFCDMVSQQALQQLSGALKCASKSRATIVAEEKEQKEEEEA